MKIIYIPLFAAMMATAPAMAQNKPLILTGQAEYYLKGISPNGEWAYGAYINYNNQAYGFRWNLKNNKIEMLSRGSQESEPTGISNNGVLAGFFYDNTIVPNGATVHNEGLWKDGHWVSVETPAGVNVMGTDRTSQPFSVANGVNGVSLNGQYAAGEVNYTQVVVWKDGKIDWSTKHNNGSICRSYCVTNDGNILGGWGYPTNTDERIPTIWKRNGQVITLPVGRYSPIMHPYQGVFSITSNERYALYWGNYLEEEPTDDNASGVSIYSAYDLKEDKVIAIPMYTLNPAGGHWYAMNANGTFIGYEQGSFKPTNEDGTVDGDSTYLFMWKDNQRIDLYKYLESKGVDFKSLPNFSSLDTQGMGISDDEKTFSMRYYGPQGESYPLIIKLDEDLTNRPPVQLSATRLSAVNGVRLEWLEPLAGADGVKSYKIYRDGQLLATTDAKTLRYTDGAVSEGQTHTYTVKAAYASTESEACDEASITLSPIQPKAPNSLFARQAHQAQAVVEWNTPKSNLTTKNYYDDENDDITGFGGGSYNFEAAINIPADELALYKSQKLTAVQFYPMTEQGGWTVNLYAHDPATGALTTILSQPVSQQLNYGKPNKVTLSQPVTVPDGKDLYVAIAVTTKEENAGYNIIGEVNGLTTPGCSDLLRQTNDAGNAFQSTYDMAQESGGASANTWAIDAIFTPEGASADIDNVASYDVTVDGEKAGNTSDLTFTTGNLSDGQHTIGVTAIYADGRKSPTAEKSISITANENYFQAIEQLDITQKGGNEGVNIAWKAPLDNDAKTITYAYAGYNMGISTNEEAYWNLTARNEYLPELFKSYEGYNITAARFYPGADAIFTLILYANNVKVAEKEVDSYTLNQWNEVRFDSPVKVQEGVTYTLDVDCYDVTAEGKPLAVDAGAEQDGYSNLFSQDGGETWSTLIYNNDIRGNWMIGLKLENDDNKVVPELQGYKVVIDTRNSYSVDKDATSYDYKPATIDSKNHRVRVDAIYDVKGTVKGNTVYFTFDVNAGIGDATIQQLEVNRNGSAIEVTGADVKDLTLIAADGKQVATAKGNTINVTNLPAGSYVLSATTTGGEVKSFKVAVK